MLASTIASSVVAQFTHGTPRRYVAATKPDRSPMTPPPNATITPLRSRPPCTNCSYNTPAMSSVLLSSPAGTRSGSTSKPDNAND